MTATVDRVVDASVMAAVAFQEPRGPEAESLIDGATLFAPVLLAYELANVARTKIRRHSVDRGLILGQLSDALAIPIQWIDVDHIQVVELALAARPRII